MSTPKMKKAKKDTESGGNGNGGGNPAHELHLSQISSLRSYIESCPHVPSDCGAVRAALNGLDAELKRAERDEKLRVKFERERERAEREERERRMVLEGDDEMDVGGVGEGLMDDDEEEEGWQDVSNPTSPAALASTPTKPPTTASATESNEALRSSPELVVPSPADPHQDSPFGRELATAAVAAIAASGTRVATPLSAVALALHGAVTSDLVGMRCTGVPDDDGSDDEDEGGSGKKKKSGGFAPPIRELPRNKFVPDGWDANAAQERKKQRVVLRYRKDGLGTTILRVSLLQKQQHEDDESEPIVRVRLTSSSAGGAGAERGGPGGAELNFPIGRHVNLDGLAAALAKAGGGVGKAGGGEGVCPSLHYIALPGLMTEFARTFDLGGVNDAAAAADAAGAATSGAMTTGAAGAAGGGGGAVPMDPSAPPTRVVPPPPTVPTVPPVGGVPGRSPQIDDLHPHPAHGDFAGDLAPGGIVDPRFGGQPGLGGGRGGSLMGPNHPAFRDGTYGGFGDDDDVGDLGVGGGYGDDPRMPYIGGTGMQPRFDPYYPPGVGPDPGRGNGGPGRGGGRGGRGRGRGGRGGRGRAPPSGGDPNPDHQRPPADYGDHMFM